MTSLSHPEKENPAPAIPRLIKLMLTVMLVIIAGSLFAQDVIYTVKGAPIKCKVQEIGEDSVSYREVAEAAIKLKSLIKTEIFRIKYANGIEDTITRVRPNANFVKATTGIPTSSGGDIITTTGGKQLAGKVTDVDDNIVSYILTGSTIAGKIDTKNIAFIKFSNGSVETYNAQGKAPAAQEKDTMALVLLNWKRKYIAPPLELF